MKGAYVAFNRWLAIRITRAVATMTCAYVFAILAICGLPGAIQLSEQTHSLLPVVMWISQNFLQLVLLSVIMVGQDQQQGHINDLKRSHNDLHDKHDRLHRKLSKKEK